MDQFLFVQIQYNNRVIQDPQFRANYQTYLEISRNAPSGTTHELFYDMFPSVCPDCGMRYNYACATCNSHK